MKTNSFPSKTRLRLLALATALLVSQTLPAAVTLTVAPSSVSNTYSGFITLQVAGLSIPGQTVVVQKYLDLNSNGIIDAGDMLVQQFQMTDGQPGQVIGGIINSNVPGDIDNSANQQITAQLNFKNGDFIQNIVGQYLFKVYSPGGSYTTNFIVTNYPFAQGFAGNVISNGTSTNVPDAIILIFPPPRPGHHGPGDPLGGTVANNSGAYSIKLPPGTYSPLAFCSNYFANLGAPPVITLGSGSNITTNLTVTNANSSISGQLVDATNSGIGLPGVFLSVQASGLFTGGFTDTNGNYNVGVASSPSQWDVAPLEYSLIVHGYLAPPNSTTTNAGQAGVIITATQATAMFYGSVTDALGHPLAGLDINASDNDNNNADGLTDAFGNYFCIALGGLTNDTWSVGLSSETTPTDYLFTQPDFETNGGTNLNVQQAVLVDFSALLATNTISGSFKDGNSNAITNVGIYATATISNVTYNQSMDTDSNGNYSLSVANGIWSVGVNTCTNCGGNDYLPADYIVSCELEQGLTIAISNNNVVTNLTALLATNTISGNLSDGEGGNITNVGIYADATIDGVDYCPGVNTDTNGNYSLNVANGSWIVCVNTGGGGNSLPPNYEAPGCLTIVIDNDSVETNFTAAVPPYTITGYLTNGSGVPLTNVGIYASSTNGGINPSANTDNTGFYTLGVGNGTWSVGVNTCTNCGYGSLPSDYLTPPNQTVVINDASGTANFTAIFAPYTISGSLTDGSGGPISGVAIYASDTIDGTNYQQNAVTDSSGDYSLNVANGTWTVGVNSCTNCGNSLPTNYLTPPNQSIGISGSGQTVNFVAPLDPYTISGHVQFEENPVVGVGVSASASIGGTNFVLNIDTDGSGNYSFNVSTNTWSVCVNCSSGNDSLDNLLGAGLYQCPTCTNVAITSSNGTANFTVLPPAGPSFNVGTSAMPPNGGTVTPGGSFPSNSSVTVTATNNSGYIFTSWTSNSVVVGSTTNYTFTLTADVNLTANFTPAGALWAMGYNYYGQLGDGTTDDGNYFTNLPEEIVTASVTTVAAGENHSLFLLANGGLWAMGDNASGDLGNGTNVQTNTPKLIVSSNVTAIAAGLSSSFFVKSDGSLWAMGDDSEGELGDGHSGSTNVPELIVSNGVSAVAAGLYHTLFLKTNGSLWAMGSQGEGQLGDGFTQSGFFTNKPEMIVPSGVTAIAAGGDHSLFVKSDGSLWAMGYDNYGQLGDGLGGNGVTTNRPEMITNGVMAIAAGEYHSLFIKSNGSLWAMGNNSYGQLGDGTTNAQSLVPEMILPGNVTAIACGYDHSLFIKSDGSLWAMGADHYGQLGNGQSGGSASFGTNVPVQIAASNVVAIAAGSEHSLFIAPPAVPQGPAQIGVFNGPTNIPNGQSVPVNFGSILQNLTGPIVTFTITNAGGQTLDVTNISVPAGFALLNDAPSTIAAGTSGTFSVQLDTTTAGGFSGNISITNNTTNNEPFVFAIKGTVTPSFAVTVNPSPIGGGTVGGGGTFASGSSITVEATNFGGYVFTNWTSNNVVVSSTTNYTFTLNASVSLVAHFLPLYTYTVSASPSDGGTVSPDGTNVSGSTITVIATNNAGFVFTNWTSNNVTVTAPANFTFTLVTNVTLVANFTTLYTYTNSASPTNGGTVSPGGTNESGAQITVTATANPGFLFTNWTSNGFPAVSTTNYTFTLSADVTNVAHFVTAPPHIVVSNGTNLITNGDTTPVVFSSVEVNQTDPVVTFTVTNTGGQTLYLTNITVPAGFVLETNYPTNIAALSNGTFSVQLITSNIGVFSGSISITNNDPALTNSTFSFEVTGTVSGQAPAIEVLLGTSIITNGEAGAVDFGTVPPNQTGPILTFTVTNSGEQTLDVTNITVPLGYTLLTNAPATIVAGSNGSFSVQLNTNTLGLHSGDITITDNDPTNNPFIFPITGFLADKIISLSGDLAFGGVAIGSPSNRNFTISNSGNATLTVSSITCPGGFSGAFSNTIAANGSASVQVTFSPTTNAAYGTTLTVNSDATSGADTLPISGYGTNDSLLLTIIIIGDGSVSPNDNGKSLKPGTRYTVKATADSGNFFAGWTGSTNTTKNPLTFVMERSTVLQANFVTNPFLTWQGTYNGLFWTTNGVTETNAGMLKGLAVTVKGTYSGSVLIDGATHAISGDFDADGMASNTIARTEKLGGPLTVLMTLINSSNVAPQLIGTVSGTNWEAALTAYHATNTLPSAEYTLLIQPDTNNFPPAHSPGGDGYALITNYPGTARDPASAAAKITGALADGTAFTQTVPVSQDGYVPVYDSLYAGKGLLLGWINLELTNTDGVSLTWIHPATRTGLYTNGFTNVLLSDQILLSPWTNASTNFFTATNLSLLQTIDDTNALTNFIVAISNNFKLYKVSGPTTLSGSVNPKTGLLTVTIGSGASKVTGTGAILLNATSGGGHFLTKTNAGAVLLQP